MIQPNNITIADADERSRFPNRTLWAAPRHSVLSLAGRKQLPEKLEIKIVDGIVRASV